MQFFRRKPSEQELELVVLRAASLTRAQEIELGSVATAGDIAHWVGFAIDEKKLKKDETSIKVGSAGVQALLTEEAFLAELMEYQSMNPGRPLPIGFREKMISAIQKTVQEFAAQR